MAPFDREGALKRAEKALRLGRVDTAIEEYQGIVLAQPRDWNSANALGDLFVRSGQLDKGVEQYTRIADHLAEEGFYPKAVGALQEDPQGQADRRVRARSAPATSPPSWACSPMPSRPIRPWPIAAARLGNVRGAAEMAVRLGTVDPEDFDARYAAAKAARELGDHETALRELRAAAVGFEEKARHDLARAAYRDILELRAGRRGRAGPGARRQHRHRRVHQRVRPGLVARRSCASWPPRSRAPVSTPRCCRCGRASPTSIRPTSTRGSGWCAAIWPPATPSRRAATCRPRLLPTIRRCGWRWPKPSCARAASTTARPRWPALCRQPVQREAPSPWPAGWPSSRPTPPTRASRRSPTRRWPTATTPRRPRCTSSSRACAVTSSR